MLCPDATEFDFDKREFTKDDFARSINDTIQLYLEGKDIANAEIKLELFNSDTDTVLGEDTVFIRLLPIKSMYQRYSVGDGEHEFTPITAVHQVAPFEHPPTRVR